MAVVRSAYPHAHLKTIELAAARAWPGVIGAFAAPDIPEVENSLHDPVPPGLKGYPRPVLASGTVRYVGEPIAVVVAEDEATAVDAAQAVDVELDPLEGVGDVLSATRATAPILHADLGSNVAGRYQTGFGDVTAAFGAEATVVRQTFRLSRVIGGYLEPRACAAAVDAETGQLTVWTSTQWVYGVRDRIAMLLGLDADRVRVIAFDVGGGFGAKGQVYPEEILVAALARRLGRPVRWVATRTEDTQATAHSHGDVAEAELAANADGTAARYARPTPARRRGVRGARAGAERQHSQPRDQRVSPAGAGCRVDAGLHQRPCRPVSSAGAGAKSATSSSNA